MCEEACGFPPYSFCHSEGWTPRNEALIEAVVKQARKTRMTPWLIACNTNMMPEDFEKSMWFQTRRVFIEAPKGASTCSLQSPKGILIERTCDYVLQKSLKGKIKQIEVVEDFEFRPHKAVSFVLERETKRCKNGRNR